MNLNFTDRLKKIPNIPWKLLLPAYSLITLVVMMVIHMSNAGAGAAFFEHGGALKLLINMVLLLAVNTLLFALTGRVSVSSAITVFLFTLFSVAVNTVYVITGKPLLPSDFLLADQLKSIVSFVDIRLGGASLVMITLAFLAIASAFLISGVKRVKLTVKFRALAAGISGFLLIIIVWLFGFFTPFISGALPDMGVSVTTSTGDDYLTDGALLSFLPRLASMGSAGPENYSKSDISLIKSMYDKNPSFEKTGDFQPSIIAIQSEAWWDPVMLPEVSFSGNPMEPFHSGMENLKTGLMITPVYGGGTCIPEFEYLTGFSSAYLPLNCYPYIQAVNGETPSIASALRDGGYETRAIHTYKTNFYGRKKAYPLLGFDSFIGSDNMDNPEIRGFYVSDYTMGDEIISAYENKASDKIFIYGLTMQNHGDYTKPRYTWHAIKAQSDKLSPEDLQGLSDYTQGVYDAGKMFFELTEYFSQIDEPVLIIMYGDHLPLLGTDGSTYIDGGFVPDTGDFDFARHECMMETPYAIWANYPLTDYDIPDELSAVGLSLFTLKAANLESVPWHFKLIDEFNQKYPIFTPHIIKNSAGEKVSSVSGEDLESEQNYRLIQHDILYGKKFSLN